MSYKSKDSQLKNAYTDTNDLSIKSQPSIHALIVAAGKGSRFGSKIAKQYTSINGKTILQHSVHALSLSAYINNVVIVIADGDKVAPKLMFSLPTQYAVGGTERWESVQSGVDAIVAGGGQPDDLVLIHDAARPCVVKEHIDAVIEAASRTQYGAILGVPVSDTLKRVDSDKPESGSSELPTIINTVDRSNLWQAQTPQVFRLGVLNKVLSEVAAKGLTITDEANAFEEMGYAIKIVKGSHQNIKLTYAEDLALIKMILASK